MEDKLHNSNHPHLLPPCSIFIAEYNVLWHGITLFSVRVNESLFNFLRTSSHLAGRATWEAEKVLKLVSKLQSTALYTLSFLWDGYGNEDNELFWCSYNAKLTKLGQRQCMGVKQKQLTYRTEHSCGYWIEQTENSLTVSKAFKNYFNIQLHVFCLELWLCNGDMPT